MCWSLTSSLNFFRVIPSSRPKSCVSCKAKTIRYKSSTDWLPCVCRRHRKSKSRPPTNIFHLEEQLVALQNEIQQVRLQMEQTQQEKLQAQQEREQAQQQFNFAQAALEKAIEKKLESVDPDSYQMFIDNLATLTPKEEDIFNLYVQGCSTKAIISQLGITKNTLKYHNKNIYSKLGVKTRKELLQYIELMRNSAH